MPNSFEREGVKVELNGKCPTFTMCGDSTRVYHVTIHADNPKHEDFVYHITHLVDPSDKRKDQHYYFKTGGCDVDMTDNPYGIIGCSMKGARNHSLDELEKKDIFAVRFLKRYWPDFLALM